jgi:toxin ParE1/3/4
MRFILTPLAEQDLEAIGDYIARDNPRRALSFVRELRSQCAKIAGSPQGYRRRPELGEAIRSCAYGNYVIFFVEAGKVVQVVRVLHGAMDIESRISEKFPSQQTWRIQV